MKAATLGDQCHSPIITLRTTSIPMTNNSTQIRTREPNLKLLLWRGMSAGVVWIDARLTVGGTVDILAAEEGARDVSRTVVVVVVVVTAKEDEILED